jgi:hypothetical protein
MKILLDIDGVMIPARPWQSYELGSDGFGMFNKMTVNYLNQIISSCKHPEIILTTSHKHSFTLKQWQEIFSNRGVLSTTMNRLDSNSLEMTRKDEILSWYLSNQNEKFIVIDDDTSLNSMDLHFKEEHLVLTSPTIGLNRPTTEDALVKIERLMEELVSF